MSKHYHFIGIGGMGMAPLASLTIDAGHRVSGSDLKENALTRQLQDKGARIFIGHEAGHVESPDYVVYSSAVTTDNPEIAAANRKEIPILRRAQLLAELAQTKTAITVAGAHGKTTTTAMIAYLMLKQGLEPTTLIGGVVQGQSYNANLGGGEYLVTEVDESDGSFLYFKPRYAVITNIDFEHVDYYQNWDNIMKAYRQFIGQAASGGCLIGCGDDSRLRQLLGEAKTRCMTFGFKRDNDVLAEDIELNQFSSRFRCVRDGRTLGNIHLNVPGRHNVLNALAAVCLGLELKMSFDSISKNLAGYEGVQRRFQLKAKVDDILVIDDYGHHPTEISATLQAAQSFGRRIITVFQPHRYSRTKHLMKELAESLALSDYLIVTDIYAASEKPIAGLHAETLVGLVRELAKTTVAYCPQNEIVAHLVNIVKPGDLVLTLGAGDIYQSGEAFIERF